jgi:hypothetical protein
MKDRDELREELKEMSPFLLYMKRKNEGFKVPKDYFRILPDELLERVRQEAKPVPARRSWLEQFAGFFQSLLQPRYAVALVTVAVLLAAGIFLLKPDTPPTANLPLVNVTLDDISDETLQAYIYENIRYIDKNLILETHFAGLESLPLQQVAPKPSVDEMEKYLEDDLDNLDLEDLL